MKTGTFISLVAVLYGVPEKTIKVFYRSLREAGQITSGAHGRNAPDLTHRDLAVMTIALLATDVPARAVQEFEFWSGLQLIDPNDAPPGFDPEHNLLHIMERLYDPTETLPSELTVEFDQGARTALISSGERSLIYLHRTAAQMLVSATLEANDARAKQLFSRLEKAHPDASPLSGIKVIRSLQEVDFQRFRRLFELAETNSEDRW